MSVNSEIHNTYNLYDQLMYKHKKAVHIHFHAIHVSIQKFSYSVGGNLYELSRYHINNQHDVEHVVYVYWQIYFITTKISLLFVLMIE